MANYNRKSDSYQFIFRGWNTTIAPDSMPPGKYPWAVNVRATSLTSLSPRLGQGPAIVTVTGEPSVHSLQRLNDSTQLGPASGFAYVAGAGDSLSVNGTILSSAFSGHRLAMASYRPTASAQPWMYVADTNSMKKVTATGLIRDVGIAEPQFAATAEVAGTQFADLFKVGTSYVKFGTGGSISTSNRVNVAITKALFDYGDAGEACIVCTITNIVAKQILTQGSNEIVVESTNTSTINSTIDSITYDSGTTGYCTMIVATGAGAVLNNSVVLLNSTEYVRVIYATGSFAGRELRCYTLSNHAAGETIVGQTSIRATCPTGLTSANLTSGIKSQSITVGDGGMETLQTGFGGNLNGRPIQSTDKLVLMARVNDHTHVSALSILFNVGPVLDFATNVLEWDLASGDFVDNTWVTLTLPVSSLVPHGASVSTWEDIATAGINGVQINWAASGTIAADIDQLQVQGSYGPSKIAGANLINYRYRFRSIATGEKSNPSPPMRQGIDPGTTGATVALTPGFPNPTGLQVALNYIDYFRDGGSLTQFTFVGTSAPNADGSYPQFFDTTSDLDIAGNDLLEFDNFEPYPLVDVPHGGTVNTNGFTVTWVSGDPFNVKWGPGTLITINGVVFTLYNRPQSTTSLTLLENAGIQTAAQYNSPQPQLLDQALPTLWGPTDDTGFFFSVGDTIDPGALYYTKGKNPDAAPDTNRIEITSPSEALVNGAIVNGLSLVMSANRGWILVPNFQQALATVTGVQGDPFIAQETITGYGLFCRMGICTDGGANVFFIASEGIRKSVNGFGSVSITDDDLYNMFPHEGPDGVLIKAKPYVLGTTGMTINPPDFTNPDGMALNYSAGFVYFDYLDSDANSWSWVYDIAHQAWSVDIYPFSVLVHADNAYPGFGVMLGCQDGTIRALAAGNAESGTSAVLATQSEDNDDLRATKHWGDIFFEEQVPEVPGNLRITLHAWGDRYTTDYAGLLLPSVIPNPPVLGQRTTNIIELNGGQGLYNRDLGLIISCPVNSTVVLYSWQPTFIPQPETIAERYSDWDNVGSPGAKYVQGIVIEADTANAVKTFAIQASDDLSLHVPVEASAGAQWNGRTSLAFSFDEPFIAHQVRLAPQDTVPWRVWSAVYVTRPIPELATVWQSEPTSHGFDGWQHIGWLNIAYIASTGLTFTLIPDNGPPLSQQLPSSDGVIKKQYVRIPANKFKMTAYRLSGPGPFRAWIEDMEIHVKPWGSSDAYQTIKPFGGPSSLGADV